MSVKPAIKYILLGVLAYGAFLVATLPAEQAFNLIRGQLKGVYLQNVSGTLWRGRVGKLQIADQAFEHVSWSLNPLSMVSGALGLDLSFDGAGRNGKGEVRLGADGSIGLHDFRAKVAMMDIDQLLGIAPIQLGGLLEVEFEDFEALGKSVKAADGVVRWKGAKATAPMAMELGNFVVTLKSTEDGVEGAVKDEGGPLQVDGVVKLSEGGDYQFTGHIAVRDKQNRMLLQGVQALGTMGADGRVAVEFKGRL